MALLDVKPYDKQFYEEKLKNFLPDTFIDCHTHIWIPEHYYCEDTLQRSQNWPSLVAKSNPIEDLNETNAELFPDKKVISVLYGQPSVNIDLAVNNEYTAKAAEDNNFPALYISHPSESCEHILEQFKKHPCFKGLKIYLEFAPSYIPTSEIRIYDFITQEQLKLANDNGWVVQIHISRPKRLADPVNYVQLHEIETNYPDLQLIIAHLGRAYAKEDIGEGIKYLSDLKKCVWDFTANTNEDVMAEVLKVFGPERFIYGTDFPIFRMKARRVVENGVYINEVPAGLYGDNSGDPHMRDIPYPEADKITFFIYEEIDSCRRACEKLGLSKNDVNNIFYANSARIFGVN
ncbi:MAG: amidohydrolase family protein [Eubacteriales bacterium]|nr:amidohydrolase family protein [Eubacteriales bacterium]